MSGKVVAKGCRLLGAALFVAAGLTAMGCGRSSSSVSGKVSYQGKIVKGGSVTFHGADNWTGTSRIAEDGAYTISKVPLGKVQITVETKTVKPNPMMSRMPKPPKDTPLPPGSMYENQGKGDLYVEIPDRYGDKDRANLTLDVTGGKQEYDIKLD